MASRRFGSADQPQGCSDVGSGRVLPVWARIERLACACIRTNGRIVGFGHIRDVCVALFDWRRDARLLSFLTVVRGCFRRSFWSNGSKLGLGWCPRGQKLSGHWHKRRECTLCPAKLASKASVLPYSSHSPHPSSRSPPQDTRFPALQVSCRTGVWSCRAKRMMSAL